MKKLYFCCLISLFALPAHAQQAKVVTTCGTAGYAAGFPQPLTQDVNGSHCTAPAAYSAGVTPLTGNAAGTTGAVVGTITSAAAQTAYICGFNVSAIGGTAAIGPIVIAGLIGSSQTYQGSSSVAGVMVTSQTFQPCIPASAVNTNITITTTADGTATAVNVNSWGFRQ